MTRFLLITTMLASLAAPAHAQSKRELADADARLAQRLQVLEQRFLTGDPAAERLMQRLDSLEVTMRSLTGDIERLTYERDQLRGEVQALAGDLRAMQDLETRMRIHLDAVDMVSSERAAAGYAPRPVVPDMVVGSTPNPGPVSVTPPAGMPPFGTVQQGQPSPTPQAPVRREVNIPVQQQFAELSALPDQGRTKLAEGNFGGAQSDFQQYLTLNPDAPDAGEIQYWLGESYYVRGGYADAAQAYIASMKKNAKGPKAPEAMVRLGASLNGLGKKAEACQTLNSLSAQYPNADASVREKARVEKARAGC